METIPILLIILLGLGVFVWLMVQKARETAARELRERPPRPKAPGLPSTSFQELLEQMKSQNKAGNEAPPVAPQPAAQPLPREPAPLPRSLERPPVPPRSLETVPPTPARSLEAPASSARRAATLPRATAQPPRNDYWARQAARSPEQLRQDARQRVQAMLRNPTDLRAALILSEILKPKYE